MADSTAGAAGPPHTQKATKPQQVTLAPFTSPTDILTSLQTRDPNALIAALTQLDKRAQAINAKPAPRATPDLLLDYLKHYPNCEGVFNAWDTANKLNSSPLSAAVLSCLTSLVRLLSTDPFTPSPELIKTLLSAKYAPYLDRALNPGRNDVTTAALKLGNVLVGFAGGRFARRVFGSFGWSPKITTRLFKTRLRTLTPSTALTKPDIRTLLVLLVLGFLSADDVRLKQQVIETKGLLSGVFKGLNEDPVKVVNLVLEVVGKEVVLERRVGLEARRNVWDEGTVNELIKLYPYPLPSLADDEELPTSHPSLSIHRFLRLLSTWLADQIASSPPGRSGGPQKVLGLVLRSLKVTEEKEQRELGLEVLRGAPILAGAFWAKFPSSLDPRLSSRWISAITFATEVVSLPVPLTLSPSLSSSSTPAPPSLTSILDTILPPPTSSSLTRTWYTKSLTHENPLVSFLSSLFLLAIMQKAAATLEAIANTSRGLEEGCEGRWAGLGRKVREELRGRLPDPGIVVGVMTRTAAAAAAAGTGGSEGKSQKAEEKKKTVKGEEDVEMETGKEEKEKEKEKKGDDGALLRSNIALRLLYLYHRVCPSLISTLKFDFGRLPQTFAARAPLPSSSSTPDPAPRAEGLQAISSAYALRLAAAHSSHASSTVAFSRPSEHYKQAVVPLFDLYRVPATPSNRTLLLSILAKQLATPVLFGENPEREVKVWLGALPVPEVGQEGEGGGRREETKGLEEVLSFWQEAVKKTLTAPVKAADMMMTAAAVAQNIEEAFSPLLKTVLAAIPALPSPPSIHLLGFIKSLFLSFLSSSDTLGLPKRILTELKDALTIKGEEGRRAVKGLKECLAVCEGGKKEGQEVVKGVEEAVVMRLREEEDVDEVRKLVDGLGPRSGNLCKALEGEEEVLGRVLAALPLPLAMLHYLAHSVSSAVPILLSLISSSSSHLLAVRLVLHRFNHSPSSSSSSSSAALVLPSLLGQIFTTCVDDVSRAEIKSMLGGKDGLRKVWERDAEKEEVYAAAAELIGQIFEVEQEGDRRMVLPFCESVMEDLNGEKATLTPRVLATAPLLPFFPTTASLPLLSALLTSLPPSSSPSPLLTSAFKLILALPPSSSLTSFWTANFSRLNSLTASGNVEAAELLRKGAEALMPFSPTVFEGKKDESWRAHAATWASEILATDACEFKPAQATNLAALVYRSVAARQAFVAFVVAGQQQQQSTLVPIAEPLRALLEVSTAKGVDSGLSDDFASRFVQDLLISPSNVSDVGLAVVDSLTSFNPSTASSVKSVLLAHLASLSRDDAISSPTVLRVAGACAQASLEGGKEVLEEAVAKTCEGLTHQFAGREEEGEEVVQVVEALRKIVVSDKQLVPRGHLLSPLITAVATRRLEQPYAVELATALSRAHRFKDNEVTRHLNEIFASSTFLAFSSAPLETSSALSSTLELILALSSSSAAAASSARTVERLSPFYRGTLSPLDRSILNLFQLIELASGQSVSPTLRSWNPSTDASTLLDGSRVAALGASQRPYMRRSWARAFASTRTVFSTEDDLRTYDPRFVIGFVAALVEEDELKPVEWTILLESGALGAVVAALASGETSLRKLARATLAGLLQKIEPLSFREKDELLLLLTQCRLAIYSPAGEAIPSSIALFLAHSTFLLGHPDSPLYPAFERFLLQRSMVDLRDVPMFYAMVYSSNSDEYAAEPREERRWMVRYLTEGLVRTQDWKIYRRRQVFELLASLFQTSRNYAPLRKLILQFLLRATTLPTAARELLTRNGLLGWISAAGTTALDIAERRLMVDIVGNLVQVLQFEEGKLAGAADAVEAVEKAVGNQVAAIETVKMLDLVRVILSRLPAPSSVPSSSLTPLILSRLSSLLTLLSSSSDVDSPTAPRDTLQRFYLTCMAFSFVRFESRVKEGDQDREVWNMGLRAGLNAGVEELRQEVVRSVCE